MADCWLRRFSEKPCEGRMDKAHLISRQTLRRELKIPPRKLGQSEDPRLWDDRLWVYACRYHHDQFDRAQPDRKRLIVPRESLPAAIEQLADELGVGYWLDRRYGPVLDSCTG